MAENLVWIKNVKRKDGNGWAYEDVKCDRTFLLNWPTSKRGSASTPEVGDVIVLFQKPKRINGRRNYPVYFTHLVSPVSDEIFLDQDHPDHKWCRKVKLIARATPIDSIPNPGYYNFFKPNRGLTNPIINLTNTHGMTEDETKEDIWRLFADFFCKTSDDEILDPKKQYGIQGELEGDKVIKEHIRQEVRRRNARIVYERKIDALKKGNGKITCECCQFDFLETYGLLGDKFMECHHKIHLAKGERITNPRDLALVCSNCHRMLHRRKGNGSYYDVETLRQLIARIKKGQVAPSPLT